MQKIQLQMPVLHMLGHAFACMFAGYVLDTGGGAHLVARAQATAYAAAAAESMRYGAPRLFHVVLRGFIRFVHMHRPGLGPLLHEY